MTLKLLGQGGLAAVLLAGCAGAADGDPEITAVPGPLAALESADVAQGRALAEGYCAACHALGVDGDSPHADAPAFRDLSTDYPVAGLEEALVEGIIVGHPDMPEFRFEPDEAAALIAFLEHVQPEADDGHAAPG